MNIFYLDPDRRLPPLTTATSNVVCMIKETVQMMSTAHRVLDGTNGQTALACQVNPHQPSSTIWVRSMLTTTTGCCSCCNTCVTSSNASAHNTYHSSTRCLSP